jgi:hypothetical protein
VGAALPCASPVDILMFASDAIARRRFRRRTDPGFTHARGTPRAAAPELLWCPSRTSWFGAFLTKCCAITVTLRFLLGLLAASGGGGLSPGEIHHRSFFPAQNCWSGQLAFYLFRRAPASQELSGRLHLCRTFVIASFKPLTSSVRDLMAFLSTVGAWNHVSRPVTRPALRGRNDCSRAPHLLIEAFRVISSINID